MRISLIITTYNRPDALELTILSALNQTRLPNEIIVGDDGSGAPTKELIDKLAVTSPVPLIHAWQDDQGFRAARVRNLAVSRASGDYLIFTDGDMILHENFIESHVLAARPGRYLCGKRAMVTSWMTPVIIRRKQLRISPFHPGITLRRHAIHSPFLAKFYSHKTDDWFRIFGANLSLWREDYQAVNGFNEDFEGWGREDSEFSFRLFHSALEKYELRFCAVAYHLSHGKNNRQRYEDETKRNQLLLKEIVAAGVMRCEHGLNAHLVSKPVGTDTN